jgi:sirohydrochlorin cobaltochelatase
MTVDRRAPMASAPMRYEANGQVAWGMMWDSFCDLALDGGPPHRGTMLEAPLAQDPTDPHYQAVAAELIRGIVAVSGLYARVSNRAGWLAVATYHTDHATWLATAIHEENVQARSEGRWLFVPLGADFTLEGEIKNVITAVAKTTHYWAEHLAHQGYDRRAFQQQIEAVRRWQAQFR